MATVYEARDKVLNRNVAVKVLKEEFITDEEFVNRFNSEAQAAASLSHPNIVSIYDVGNEENIYYIVMELVRGKTLKQIITEEGALPWKWSVNIAMQIASALELAHKNNIIHRDIKPHNIIITEDGVAKVTDFGIAKAVSNSTITAFGTTIGSVHYFSPEQAKGGYTDAKSDIYSLGVVMYEMLTGKVPFDSDTSVSVALKHMQEAPVPPMEVNENIPKAVNDIILKAMQKEPMARYNTATAMISDLARALKEPDGDFVGEDNIDEGLTRRMGAITNDMLDKNNKTSKNKKKNDNKKKTIIISVVVAIILIVGIALFAIFGSRTPKDVQIPQLVGLTEEQAVAELNKLNLVYEKIEENYNSEYTAGLIYEQSPSYIENYKIKEKSTIQVKVSKGVETTTVPKVVGMTYDEAVNALKENKLNAERVEETSQTVEEGVVISQETAENTTVNAGDTVKIHVSIGTGIPQVVMPYVVGHTEADAKAMLEDKKLSVVIEYTEETSRENGTVLSQNIEKGTNIDEGTEVTLVVNKLPETKTATITINVKSIAQRMRLTGNTTTSSNNEIAENTTNISSSSSSTQNRTIRLRVEVAGEQRANEDIDINTTDKTLSFPAVGTVEIKIYLDGNLIDRCPYNLNVNETTEYTFE